MSVNEDAIKYVTEVLGRLESGESVGVCIVDLDKDGDTVRNVIAHGGHFHRALSGAAMLNARLASQVDPVDA